MCFYNVIVFFLCILSSMSSIFTYLLLKDYCSANCSITVLTVSMTSKNACNSRRRSPIESYRNHIPCGDLSCKNSCDHNSLKCIGCSKNFHYKCNKVSERAYLNIIDNNLDYYCDTIFLCTCVLLLCFYLNKAAKTRTLFI